MTTLFSFVFSFFWGGLLAIFLWIVVAYWGKLFFANFKASKIHHLLLLVIAIASCVCFGLIFNLNKVNGYVKKTQTFVVEEITGRIKQAGNQAAPVNVESITEMIKDEYPILSKYIDIKTLSGQVENITAATNTTQVVEATVISITETIRSTIKSIRRKVVFVLLLFQLLAFGVITYAANKERKRNSFLSSYADYDTSTSYTSDYD